MKKLENEKNSIVNIIRRKERRKINSEGRHERDQKQNITP